MTANATAGGVLLSCRSVAVAAAAVATTDRKRRLRHSREKSGSRQLRYTSPGLFLFLFLQGRRALLQQDSWRKHCTDLLRWASQLLQVPRRRSGLATDEADEAPLVEKVLASGKKVL